MTTLPHLETGLMYTKNNVPDNVNRFVNKFKKNIKYGELNFKDYEKIYMLWSPYIRIPKNPNTKHNQLKDLEEIKRIIENEEKETIELIYNSRYLDCINELRSVARKTTQAMNSPIMRFLQIEEKLLSKFGK